MSDAVYNTEFNRKVDKSEIPVCNIMGVDVAVIDMDWVVRYLLKNIEFLSGDYMCVSNVHTTVTAFKDKHYLKVQNGGVMAIPDGGPLSSVANCRGYSEMKRATGPDLMEEMFKVSAKEGIKHYFYGSTEETLEKLRVNLESKYPGMEIAGMYSPPFRPLTKEEDEEIVKQINALKADIVWVGLGAPKQELWMADHQGRIQGMMIGVGAGFDYHAGKIKRAPQWMQTWNLEWLFRLLQDPKKLFKRYLTTNFCFIWNAVIRGK